MDGKYTIICIIFLFQCFITLFAYKIQRYMHTIFYEIILQIFFTENENNLNRYFKLSEYFKVSLCKIKDIFSSKQIYFLFV